MAKEKLNTTTKEKPRKKQFIAYFGVLFLSISKLTLDFQYLTLFKRALMS